MRGVCVWGDESRRRRRRVAGKRRGAAPRLAGGEHAEAGHVSLQPLLVCGWARGALVKARCFCLEKRERRGGFVWATAGGAVRTCAPRETPDAEVGSDVVLVDHLL